MSLNIYFNLPEDTPYNMEIDICTWLFIATLFIIAQYSKVPKYPNRRYVE